MGRSVGPWKDGNQEWDSYVMSCPSNSHMEPWAVPDGGLGIDTYSTLCFLESSFWSPLAFGKILPENSLTQSLMHKRTKGRDCVCSGAVEKEAE